jgi:hypothetical protein
MFEEHASEVSKFVKSIIQEENAMQRKFYSKLECVVDENEIIEKVMDKWNEMVDMPSYHELRDLLKKRLNITNNNEIDENIRLKSCYWAEKCHCITDKNLSLHAVNCHNGQRWYANDLDDYFGIELYKYDLIVGGPNHGTFIINGNHNENENEEDIEIKLADFNQKFECIENINKLVQDVFNENKNIKERNAERKKNFELYRKKNKIKKIIEVYTMFKTKYYMMIGYNERSKKIYNVFNKKRQELNTEACELLSINNNYDEDLKILCEELINTLDVVNNDIKTWYTTIEDKINTKFNQDISKYICEFI